MSGLTTEQASNINGPSVIRVPEWIEKPMGRYYLYFAHHHGKYIRLAYADSLEGTWTIYKAGALSLDNTIARKHIASPDVHVDEEQKIIKMYFHGKGVPGVRGQVSFVAFSKDGIHFQASKDILGTFYFRVFQHNGWYCAIAKKGRMSGGIVLRSKDGLKLFEEGHEIIPRMRHAAVLKEDNRLLLFYSHIGDNPESILFSEIDLDKDWTEWKPSKPMMVIKPEMDYEGARLPAKASSKGASNTLSNQLRDPYVFKDKNSLYLFYSVAGEAGIALAELKAQNKSNGDEEL